MRLFQPFEFPLEKIETLDIGDDRRLSRPVRRFEIRGIQRAAHIVTGARSWSGLMRMLE